MKFKKLFILILISIALLTKAKLTLASDVYYLHPDHLRSVSVVTKDGEVVSRESYYPYGTERVSEGVSPTEKGYTGQISDQIQTGLMYYNARYYNPLLSIFTQPDQVRGGNRFAYANGNPIKYADPTGNEPSVSDCAIMPCGSNSTDILVIGDSLSESYFPDYLNAELSNTGSDFDFVGGEQSTNGTGVNREALRGYTYQMVGNDLLSGTWNDHGKNRPVNISADIVVLRLGTNDINNYGKKEISQISIPSFEKLVDELVKANPEATIVVGAVLPIAGKEEETKYMNDMLKKKIAELKSKGVNIRFVEFNVEDPQSYYADDPVHPTKEALELMAKRYAEEIMNSVLNDPYSGYSSVGGSASAPNAPPYDKPAGRSSGGGFGHDPR